MRWALRSHYAETFQQHIPHTNIFYTNKSTQHLDTSIEEENYSHGNGSYIV